MDFTFFRRARHPSTLENTDFSFFRGARHPSTLENTDFSFFRGARHSSTLENTDFSFFRGARHSSTLENTDFPFFRGVRHPSTLENTDFSFFRGARHSSTLEYTDFSFFRGARHPSTLEYTDFPFFRGARHPSTLENTDFSFFRGARHSSTLENMDFSFFRGARNASSFRFSLSATFVRASNPFLFFPDFEPRRIPLLLNCYYIFIIIPINSGILQYINHIGGQIVMELMIGKAVHRKDADVKVTGAAEYTDDMSDAQMMHVKLKVSSHAHAKLKKIDISKAENITGVHAIIIGQAHPLTGAEIKDRPILAYDRVRYFGEPIAAVVAEHPFIAKRAADLIEVTYEDLPTVNSPQEALRHGATLVHENFDTYETIKEVYPVPNTNIANLVKVRKGNIEEGRKKSQVTIKENFSLAQSDHSAMETRCAIVEIKPDGNVHITSTTQAPYGIKKEFSEIFNLEEGKIVAKAPFVGGAFGGKVAIQLELIAYLASKAVGGKKVKLLYTREQDMLTAPVRMGLEANIELGATKEGKLTFTEITYLIDTGAYADKGTLLTKAVAATCTGPYQIDHVSCDAKCVYTNHPYITAYRGFSHSEILFVFERAMDILARKLGIDPLEFRQKNAIKKGHTSPTQTLLNESSVGDLSGCIKQLKESMNWQEEMIIPINDRKIRAKGICCSWKTSTISGASSGVLLPFNADGSVNILSGIVEIGMGTKTVLAQLLAERLKMDVNKIHVLMEVDTGAIPEHYKTVASRGTLLAGRALLKAADDAVEQLRDIASRVLVCSPEDLEVGYEKVYVRDDPSTYVYVKDVCYGYQYPNGHSIGGQVIGRGNYTIRHLTHLDPQTGEGKTGPEWTVGAQGVEIEFDTRDLTYKILKAYSVIDIGKVLNEKTALGQVMGSMSMGLNHASAETFAFAEDGTIQMPTLRTYGSFRYGDHPLYVASFLKTAHLDGPYGARGVGEHALIGMPAALANALSNATGHELNKLPLTPEYIWQEKAGAKEG